MFRIVVESGKLRGKAYTIPSGHEVTLGRDTGCFVHVADPKISRRHLALTSKETGCVLRDINSSNGSYVNGLRVKKHDLKPGDMIRIGDTFLCFLDDAQDPLIGRTLSGYLLEKRIGRGGMGTVYKAVQLSLDRPVAFKVLAPDVQDDQDFLKQFMREAKSAAKLNHANVVQIHNAGESGGFHFLSMEYMPGGSLQGILDKESKLSPARLVPLMLDSARALVWAEQNHIVHRDIKPDNLMLDSRGALKVGDFGLAADPRTSKTLYAGGKVIGTPHFMAPEQALGKPVDHRADIYALGSTMYAALSGTKPFEGDTPLEILLKKVKDTPTSLAKLMPSLPPSLTHTVDKMMELQPEKRIQTAREVYKVLSDIQERL